MSLWLLGAALAAGILVGVALRRRGAAGGDVPAAGRPVAEPLAAADAAAAVGEPAAPWPEHLIERIRTERGFDDLAQFGLVAALESYLAAARRAEPANDAAWVDRVMAAALADSILKLEEPGVPREIAGQRLAEVFTKCQEAADWDDLPRTQGYARRFLAREDGLAAKLQAETR